MFKFIKSDGDRVKKEESLYKIIDKNGFRVEDDEKLRISRRFIIDLSADMTESL